MTSASEHLEAIRKGAEQHPYRYEPPLDFLIEIENAAGAALVLVQEAITRLDGHKINPLTEEMHDDEFYLVSCTCGWKVAYISLGDAFALYADHLEANAVVALAALKGNT